jgi:heme-degrading monooxygenase HmoA
MAVLAMMEIPGATTADYDRVNEILGITPSDPPAGLVSHTVGSTDAGLMIADVWESQQAFEEFFTGRNVAGAIEQVGVTPGEARFADVHNHLPGAGTEPVVLVVIESDAFTPDLYDALTAEMPAHTTESHPSVAHVAATTADGGMIFVDVWDSEESFNQFVESQIVATSGGADMPPLEPRFYAVHNRMTGA